MQLYHWVLIFGALIMSIGIGIGYYLKSTFNQSATLSFEINGIPVFLFVLGIGFILFGAIMQSIYDKKRKTHGF